MAKTYTQLVREIEGLQAKADAARRREASGVIARVKEAIEVYALTAEDLGLSGAPNPLKGSVSRVQKRTPAARHAKPAIKYRDDAGNNWTGRGSRPRWLAAALAAGEPLEAFKVDDQHDRAANHRQGASRSAKRMPKATRRVSAAKYKDESGHTWSGRGPRPAWLKAAIASGKALEEMSA